MQCTASKDRGQGNDGTSAPLRILNLSEQRVRRLEKGVPPLEPWTQPQQIPHDRQFVDVQVRDHAGRVSSL